MRPMGRSSRKELAAHTRQLGALVAAGVPVVQALATLGAGSHDATLARAWSLVAARVERGAALSQAMAAVPGVYDRVYVALVAAGEASGTLDLLLARQAGLMEADARLRARVAARLIYPAAVAVVALIVVALLVGTVAPSLAANLGASPESLPWPTRLVLALARPLLVLVVLALAAAVVAALVLSRLREAAVWDRMLLGAPLVGRPMRLAALARLSRVLATLHRAGLPSAKALELVAAGSEGLAAKGAGARAKLQRGATLAEALSGGFGLPPVVAAMVATGEQSGQLDTMLDKGAEWCEDEVGKTLDRLAALALPVMLVVLGVVVAVVVAAVVLPLLGAGGGIEG